MLIKKVIEFRVEVENYLAMYSDPGRLMSILKERFENKCYKGCLILKVLEIKRQSACVISNYKGYIDVMFEVEAIEYNMGDIITGFRVIKVETIDNIDHIIAESTYCTTLVANRQLASIRVGQIILLEVVATRYAIGASKIAVSTQPITRSAQATYYKVNATGTVDDTIVAPLIAAIESVRPSTPTKSWQYFEALMRACEGEPGQAGENVLDVVRNIDKYTYIGMDPKLKLGLVATGEPGTAPVVDFLADNTAIASILLQNYYSRLQTIAEMEAIYGDDAKILNDHKNLWLILTKSKVKA